jgi:hypothetical protein
MLVYIQVPQIACQVGTVIDEQTQILDLLVHLHSVVTRLLLLELQILA